MGVCFASPRVEYETGSCVRQKNHSSAAVLIVQGVEGCRLLLRDPFSNDTRYATLAEVEPVPDEGEHCNVYGEPIVYDDGDLELDIGECA